MLPDIGAAELLVIAVVALIVVGPKDLPMLLRRLGEFMARLRGMAAEFRASFDDMARQSELEDLRREVDAMRRGAFTDPSGGTLQAPVNAAFDDIERSLSDVGVTLHGEPSPPLSIEAAPEAAAPAEAAAAPKRARRPRKPKVEEPGA